jgi:hypothetical protein
VSYCGACGSFANSQCKRWPNCVPAQGPYLAELVRRMEKAAEKLAAAAPVEAEKVRRRAIEECATEILSHKTKVFAIGVAPEKAMETAVNYLYARVKSLMLKPKGAEGG